MLVGFKVQNVDLVWLIDWALNIDYLISRAGTCMITADSDLTWVRTLYIKNTKLATICRETMDTLNKIYSECTLRMWRKGIVLKEPSCDHPFLNVELGIHSSSLQCDDKHSLDTAKFYINSLIEDHSM